MEQKRTLWIVSAVGVFLLVVVGAALIMCSPTVNGSGQKTPSIASGKAPNFNQNVNQFDNGTSRLPPPPMHEKPDFPPPAFGVDLASSSEGQNASADVSGSGTSGTITSENVTVYAKNATVYGPDGKVLDLNDLKNGFGPGPNGQVTQETTINVLPATSREVAVQNDSYLPKVETSKSQVTVKAAPQKVEQPKVEQPKVASKSTVQKPAPKTTTAAKPAPKAPDTYWIQIAAYEMKKNADEVRGALESKKIKTEVFTFEKGGKLYYRVRVGPYTTKSEAQYWQNQIAATSGIDTKGSYIVAN